MPFATTGLKITPIALPDPPLLHAGGCHGPYFLRNVVELTTDEGIVGLGEAPGGSALTAALEKAGGVVAGKSAFAYRGFAAELMARWASGVLRRDGDVYLPRRRRQGPPAAASAT